MPAIVTINGGVLTDDNDHQQIDRAAAEPAAGSFSYPADGLSWDRPVPMWIVPDWFAVLLERMDS
jgi:hypothetical protein